jgi:hypothetical protein
MITEQDEWKYVNAAYLYGYLDQECKIILLSSNGVHIQFKTVTYKLYERLAASSNNYYIYVKSTTKQDLIDLGFIVTQDEYSIKLCKDDLVIYFVKQEDVTLWIKNDVLIFKRKIKDISEFNKQLLQVNRVKINSLVFKNQAYYILHIYKCLFVNVELQKYTYSDIEYSVWIKDKDNKNTLDIIHFKSNSEQINVNQNVIEQDVKDLYDKKRKV